MVTETIGARFNVVDHIIAYENGSLDFDETVELFQHLVDSGLAWELQGAYGRMAVSLIEQGYITRKGRES
jgi:hypothetical protein